MWPAADLVHRAAPGRRRPAAAPAAAWCQGREPVCEDGAAAWTRVQGSFQGEITDTVVVWDAEALFAWGPGPNGKRSSAAAAGHTAHGASGPRARSRIERTIPSLDISCDPCWALTLAARGHGQRGRPRCEIALHNSAWSCTAPRRAQTALNRTRKVSCASHARWSRLSAPNAARRAPCDQKNQRGVSGKLDLGLGASHALIAMYAWIACVDPAASRASDNGLGPAIMLLTYKKSARSSAAHEAESACALNGRRPGACPWAPWGWPPPAGGSAMPGERHCADAPRAGAPRRPATRVLHLHAHPLIVLHPCGSIPACCKQSQQ
jgi:hypothetical protein